MAGMDVHDRISISSLHSGNKTFVLTVSEKHMPGGPSEGAGAGHRCERIDGHTRRRRSVHVEQVAGGIGDAGSNDWDEPQSDGSEGKRGSAMS